MLFLACGDGFCSSCLDQNLVFSWIHPLKNIILFVDLNVDWGLPEPTGTTEDWGAEDWGSDKQNDTSNTPSWATTVDDKTASTWETDVPANQNLTNHMNHLPEW